jgi:hypothetical protein
MRFPWYSNRFPRWLYDLLGDYTGFLGVELVYMSFWGGYMIFSVVIWHILGCQMGLLGGYMGFLGSYMFY